MDAISEERTGIAALLPVSLSLFLWTMGASAMDLRIAPAPKEHRVSWNLGMERAQIEHLQRWVNTGHDSWRLDPPLVAAAALQRISPEFDGYEPASLSAEVEQSQNTKMVYTFHSMDGRTTYRITLLGHRYLLRSAVRWAGLSGVQKPQR